MKRLSFFIGLVLMMILIPELKTDVFGQTPCCTTGTYGYHYYLNSSGWCEQSSVPQCGSSNCVQCDYSAFAQCITSGGTWNPSTCSCTPNCSNNSQQALSCYSIAGMMWNSTTCTCVQDPSYFQNPCAFPTAGAPYLSGWYFTGACLSCKMSCGMLEMVITIPMYGSNGEYCYSYEGSVFYNDVCMEVPSMCCQTCGSCGCY